MRRVTRLLLFVALSSALRAQPFPVRGALPWHNFLSGPTAWDESDYERYLEWMKRLGLNLLTLHCYTGGGDRYVNYVEPMIRIEYRGVVPEAALDTSLTARWGDRPLAIQDFPFGLAKYFSPPQGVRAFGSAAAVLARTNEERYQRAQALIRRVVEMAHARGIQVGMGFEFGVYPPEFYSIAPQQSYVETRLLPDPTHPASIEILRLTIDDVLKAYPGLDWMFLWLQEIEPPASGANVSAGMRALMEKEGALFPPEFAYSGVRALAYVREAHRYLARRAPKMHLAIGGWGGPRQLPPLLKGLDAGLPRDIVFTCLNPGGGSEPQSSVLAGIARHRDVWAIPWLESDGALWHPQPRVARLREHVRLAREQGLQGVLAIHWRTAEMRANMEAFAAFARNPASATTVDSFYAADCRNQYGDAAVAELAPLLAQADAERWFEPVDSPVYYPYDPAWGRLNATQRAHVEHLWKAAEKLSPTAQGKHAANLRWLAASLRFVLLLDRVGVALEPAYRLKEDYLRGKEPDAARLAECRKSLESAPLEEMFGAYAGRLSSRGELGTLASLCQRVWLQYAELRDFLLTPER